MKVLKSCSLSLKDDERSIYIQTSCSPGISSWNKTSWSHSTLPSLPQGPYLFRNRKDLQNDGWILCLLFTIHCVILRIICCTWLIPHSRSNNFLTVFATVLLTIVSINTSNSNKIICKTALFSGRIILFPFYVWKSMTEENQSSHHISGYQKWKELLLNITEHWALCVQSFLTSIAPQIPNTSANNVPETLAASGKKQEIDINNHTLRFSFVLLS